MAHERITSDDIVGDVIVQWTDESGTVSLGLIWDDPDGAAPGPPREFTAQTDVTAESAARPGEGQVSGVIERRVEHGPGGTVAVPTAVFSDPGAEDGGARSAPLQAYLDSQGRWSIYMQLDRPKVNGLIRALRRARNKAFGADE